VVLTTYGDNRERDHHEKADKHVTKRVNVHGQKTNPLHARLLPCSALPVAVHTTVEEQGCEICRTSTVRAHTVVEPTCSACAITSVEDGKSFVCELYAYHDISRCHPKELCVEHESYLRIKTQLSRHENKAIGFDRLTGYRKRTTPGQPQAVLQQAPCMTQSVLACTVQ